MPVSQTLINAINIYGFRLAGKKIAELKVLLYIFGLKIKKFGLKKTGLKKVLPPNTELLNAGLPQSDIVLAFHAPSDAYGGKLRALTEFAPA
ncbi:hypothetical protein [Nostoc sp.]|uniref:hypothetical protein n=1 Tax=Nostoc sp. TaxID=1180 RepID=UPI003BEF3718